MRRHLFLPFFLFSIPILCSFSSLKLKPLYNSLDPLSVSQNLAFYELYPESKEGEHALTRAWKLLSKQGENPNPKLEIPFLPQTIQALIALINKQPFEQAPLLAKEELQMISRLASSLANRSLKGHYAAQEEEILRLPPEEIDLARSLFLSQLNEDQNALQKARNYEALLDLMALQILVHLKEQATPEEKIQAINHFIFEEMGFRFPPHSLYAKHIDLYTFLPSVLDSRRGVCLGVSILYLCIAQRIALPLEMVTPPGHIYIRYRSPEQEINIETTARGIHLASEEYLSIETRSLQQRNIKEVIGLAHFNQAAVYLASKEYQKALDAYLIAERYLPADMFLKELIAYSLLFTGNTQKGKTLLKQVENYLPDYAIFHETIAEDYLRGFADIEAMKVLFIPVDENRPSIEEKQKKIMAVLDKFPSFRAALFHLAVTWLQLHREKEALEVLQQYHKLEPNDPTAEYYLAVLHAKRLNYAQAWIHLRQVEMLTYARNHRPKALKELRKELAYRSPE